VDATPLQLDGNTRPPRSARLRPFLIVGLPLALATLAVHVASYSWCPSLTLFDLRFEIDEGLVAFELPLTPLAPKASLTTSFNLYKRGSNGWVFWDTGAPGKCPYRAWMNLPVAQRGPGFLFLDFGYWRGGWESDSRPGPFLFVFLPVWFVGLCFFVIALAIYYRRIRFTVRTLLILTALCALLFGLLSLHSAI
jgi:hypothetical protein